MNEISGILGKERRELVNVARLYGKDGRRLEEDLNRIYVCLDAAREEELLDCAELFEKKQWIVVDNEWRSCDKADVQRWRKRTYWSVEAISVHFGSETEECYRELRQEGWVCVSGGYGR